MAKIFLSHSSKDKEFVGWLATQLKSLGHDTWLDAWKIGVGDCIVSEIEDGLDTCDYVVLVLSPNSVSSTWVDREWKTRYWDEIQNNKMSLLPVLLEKCAIPKLIQTRKYADFTNKDNHAVELAKLALSISPVLGSDEPIKSREMSPQDYSVTELLSRLGSRKEPLAQIISDTLNLAHKIKNKGLGQFCKGELTGWKDKKSDKVIAHRLIEAYASGMQINMSYVGFRGSIENAFTMLKNNPDKFKPIKFFMSYSISQLEAFASEPKRNAILHVTMPLSDYNKQYKGEGVINIYLREDSYQILVESIRHQLTTKLVKLLPKI